MLVCRLITYLTETVSPKFCFSTNYSFFWQISRHVLKHRVTMKYIFSSNLKVFYMFFRGVPACSGVLAFSRIFLVFRNVPACSHIFPACPGMFQRAKHLGRGHYQPIYQSPEVFFFLIIYWRYSILKSVKWKCPVSTLFGSVITDHKISYFMQNIIIAY